MSGRPPGPPAERDEARVIEDWFVRSGLPHLQADYDPREDTLTRLRPALVVLLVAALALVLRPDWSPWLRVLAVCAGLGILLGGFVLVNLLRGRPPIATPERVGFLEAGVIVLVPAAASLALGDDIRRVAWVALGSVAAAVALYALTSVGVVPVLVGLLGSSLERLAATASVAVRALPPLLAILLFLSLASETWQAFGGLEGWRYGVVLILFGVLATLILVIGLRRERLALYAPRPGDDLARAAAATPAAGLVERGVSPVTQPLERMARVNVSVALVVALGLRVLAVGLGVGAAFLVFGLLIVDRDLVTEWVGAPPHVLLAIEVSGREVVVTEALVRVASVLGGFAALYFAAVALAEDRYRRDFLDDELDRFGGAMAAWCYYRGALAEAAAVPTDGGAAGTLTN